MHLVAFRSMLFGEVASSVFSFLLQGSSSGWFGLACPGHCVGSLSFSVSLAFGGFCAGALTTLFLLRLLPTYVSGLTLCMGDDLARTIAEVQGALERRSDIRARFPACPPHCLLLRTTSLPPTEVLEGTVATPDPTPVLSLRPTVYIVLPSERLDRPARFATFRVLRAAVGPLEGTRLLHCSRHSLPCIAMNAEALKVDGESAGTLCTIKWPPVPDVPDRALHLLLPLLRRPGAFLAALLEDVQSLSTGEALSVFGPSVVVSVPAVEEGDLGEDVAAGYDIQVILLDLDESLLSFMGPFDPVTEPGLVVGFEPAAPHVMPAPEDLMKAAVDWVSGDQAPGLAYVTAQEGSEGHEDAQPKRAARAKRVTTAQLAEQVNQLASVLPGLVEQVRLVSERQAAQASAPQPPAAPPHQQNFPQLGPTPAPQPAPLAGLAAALPPPARLGLAPKTAPAPAAPAPAAAPKSSALPASSDQLATAIAQQGQALSLLVSHLASQGEALDLNAATAGLSTKGSAKREKLQQELMTRTGSFYLQVCQNAYRRLYPAATVPATLAEMKADGKLSFVTYMERFGGYGQCRDLALVMHQLAFIADCLVQDDVHGAREHLGLLLASTEQAAQDRNWSLAYLLCLLEEPAPQVYTSRTQGAASRLRAFTPLVSATWGSTALSYVKELDALAQRRKDTVSPKQPSADAADDSDDGAPAPKRRPRLLPPPPLGCEPTSFAPRAPRTPSDVPCPLSPQASPSGPCPATSVVPSSVAPPPPDAIGSPAGQQSQCASFSSSAALSFRRWAFSLAPRLLAGKTAFSAFFKRTLHLRWCGQPAPASVFLPLPIPCPGAFQPLGHAGQRRRQKLACQVALHAVVVAVNFVHNDCKYVPLRLLARPPNPAQVRCLRYLRGLVQTFGDVEDGIFPAETGRRMNSLLARLSEVSQRLSMLGPLGDPYARVPAGIEVPQVNDSPHLEPYRSLCASRLRLAGRANWDPGDLLPPELAMAFALPSSLLSGRVPAPEEYPLPDRESVPETRSLALKWASLDLLHLEPAAKLPAYEFTRVFNAYKNLEVDRQIGDRRGRNAVEARLPGPSRFLPTADVLCALSADARTEGLCLSVSDRRDFYHQIGVPWARCVTNRLYPAFRPEVFRGTPAYDRLCARCLPSYTSSPGLTPADAPPLGSWPSLVQPCFRAVLQGDHIGVEPAVAGHQQLLIGAGLLRDETRLLGGHPVGPGPVWDALVINDYFCVARTGRRSLLLGEPSASSSALDRALNCYAHSELIGSPEKDLRDELLGKAAGAEINSTPAAASRGHILVSAPASKRLALSELTLELSTFPATSDCLHSCLMGAWTSVALFRRPAVACFQHAYSLFPASSLEPSSPKTVPLPRRIAMELQLISLIAPLAVTDVSAPYIDRLYATDSSEHKGAYVSAAIPRELSESLWLCSDRKGAYARLASKAACILHRSDPLHEDVGHDPSEEPAEALLHAPRPLAYHFDFLELSLGPPALSGELSRLGYAVGPFIDLRLSSDGGLPRLVVLEWAMHLVDAGRLLGLYLVPPCSCGLPAVLGAHPETKTTRRGVPAHLHEEEALRLCILLFRHACRRGICALLELPREAAPVGSRAWQDVLARFKAEQVDLSACAFGDTRLRSLSCLAFGLDCGSLRKDCPGCLRHAPPKSGSSSLGFRHCAGLTVAYGRVFRDALRSLASCTRDADLDVAGLERQAVNDLALGLRWKVDSVWTWPRPVHINILESSVLCRLYKEIAITHGACRFVAFCDSFVALSSLGKGRSSSSSLRHATRRASMICLAAASTREAVKQDASRPRLRRWASSWVRLALLLRPSLAFAPASGLGLIDAHLDFRAFVRTQGFDSSLGFPGEGPCSCPSPALSISSFFLVVGLLGRSPTCLGFFVLGRASAMDASRAAKGDAARLLSRAGKELKTGRPVQRTTELRREKLKELFGKWLLTFGQSFEWFLMRSRADPDFANEVLICYGQHLYKTGKTYSSYSETLNMFSSHCPSLRRLLQPAWDLAFSWQRDEPPVHHTAMPWQVLTAAVAVALIYGWVDLAGILSLCWGGLARVGEALAAVRSDLVFPADVGSVGMGHLLMTVREPKTRFRAARHQSLRVDQPQLLRVLTLAFGSLEPSEKLWSFSGSTLRNRFQKLMLALRLGPGIVPKVRDFDMGSLRAGGATWLMDATENPDYVRRRGRWITTKVMEIYVQEVTALTFLPRLPDDVKQHVFAWAGAFAATLEKAERWHEFSIPPSSWRYLAAHGA
ncbi:unnamed protein product [Symbiodinium sp. CCMP2592]|nr:unnamed protein product [Symbiodinium sp. CCMP2592]